MSTEGRRPGSDSEPLGQGLCLLGLGKPGVCPITTTNQAGILGSRVHL